MQIGNVWVITIETLTCPWHVGSHAMNWYIVNIETKETVIIGPIRRSGINHHDRAIEEAKRRNESCRRLH